ncbi:MAG: phosphatase PAP2 family protein [Acidobacteriota bacterium]
MRGSRVRTRGCIKSRYYGVRFRLVDLNCVGYLALLGVALIFFHKEVPRWPFRILIHAALIILILEIVRKAEVSPGRRGFRFLRTFYPLVIILFSWAEVGAFSRMFCGDFWFTDELIRLDLKVFGVHPTVWIQKFYQPWLDELMNVFYTGYYLFLPVVTLTLYLKKKYDAALAAFSIATLTLLTNFFLFFLFPALSPQMAESLQPLHPKEYSGYFVASLTKFIQAHGAQPGGTFPSSHISEAIAWSLAALRYQANLGYFLLVFVVGVSISTVYLGYHHALDPILGVLWGIAWFPIALKILKARREDPGRPGRR